MLELKANSAWDETKVAQFLDETLIPIRVACSGDAGPLICSLWYLFDGQHLWCATQRSASVVTLLARDRSCGFEIAPDSMPYRGVRGQGKATLSEELGAPVLLQLIDRYLGGRDSEFAEWLIARSAEEVAIRIESNWLTSWDFSARMKSTGVV